MLQGLAVGQQARPWPLRDINADKTGAGSCYPARKTGRWLASRAAGSGAAAAKGGHTLTICTNKTCKKQGSKQIAQFVQDLGLEELEVHTSGCLAKCGNGPNMVIQPGDQVLSHVSTPARMAEVLRVFCDLDVSAPMLRATEPGDSLSQLSISQLYTLRLAGNEEARSGDLQRAVQLYSQALDLDPPRGRHLLLANRAGAKMGLGSAREAAQDARAAADCAPPGFTTAHIRLVEAYGALEDYAAASDALEEAAGREPGFSTSADYKSLRKQLDRALRGR